MTNLETIKLGVYEKSIPLQLSWKEKFECAKNAGFDFIELSVDGLEPRINRLDWDDAQINEIRHAMEETGVPLMTMALTANRYYPLGESDSELRNKGIEIVRKGIRLAVRLGIRTIQLAPYDVYKSESTAHTRALFIEALRELVPYAADHGVVLTIEVMPDEVPFCSTVQQARAIVDLIGSPYLQIYTDTGNVASNGLDPVPDLCYGGTHLVASHIKDATLGCCRKVPFGEGIVDFEACFREFRRLDFHGMFIAEMWSDEDEGFIPYLTTAVNYIRGKIKAANQD